MRKVSLYIADKEVDLDDTSFILFNYTMEDLSNPTIVKNSFSKQITLKGTLVNNEIFGNLYKSDRKTIIGEGYTGVQFDPLRKTPFKIYNEMGEIIESGYVKVDSIDKVSEGYEYKVTLYGGLGSLFYGLTYDSEGNKRTLHSLKWKLHFGYEVSLGKLSLNKDMLCNAWTYLQQGDAYFDIRPLDYWDIINFAPCYNGLPSDFDANKVLFNDTQYYPFKSAQMAATIDSKNYGVKEGCTSVLATLSDKHTEWEMRSIIPYLQRPVVRLSAILEAIIMNAREMGITLTIDNSLKSSKYYQDTWVTLPMIKKEDRYSSELLKTILSSSLTPCEYLLSFAKMCGAIFLCNAEKNNVTLIPKNVFYDGSKTIDLTNRIDTNTYSITPLVTASKWYRMGGDKVVGEEAESYKEKYGKEYGEQRINTGYEFNSEINPLTKDIPFIGAVDVLERSALCGDVWMPFYGNIHPVAILEEVKIQLYNGSDNTIEVSHHIPFASSQIVPWGNIPYADWLPKVQFHQSENKSQSGEHCLLFFNGFKEAPEVVGKTFYYVGDDHPDIESLNSGTPCWNLDDTLCVKLYGLPSFRRLSEECSLDWGLPLEIYTEGSLDGVLPLYERFWKQYLVDQYDVDSKVLKCKVNLSGMVVGQELMRNFFFFENAIWVLNKISNHSITTDDLTECEFIKVKDIKNYTQGQKL